MVLQKMTGYKLLYNHLSLELVHQFFDFDTPHFKRLDKEIRFAIFKEVAESSVAGLIFTVVWDFNSKEDEDYINEIISIFKKRNANIGIVELVCDMDERLRRNRTDNRLQHKPSKRDIAFSDRLLKNAETSRRMHSREGEFPDKNIMKIENTGKSAEEVAAMIVSAKPWEG